MGGNHHAPVFSSPLSQRGPIMARLGYRLMKSFSCNQASPGMERGYPCGQIDWRSFRRWAEKQRKAFVLDPVLMVRCLAADLDIPEFLRNSWSIMAPNLSRLKELTWIDFSCFHDSSYARQRCNIDTTGRFNASISAHFDPWLKTMDHYLRMRRWFARATSTKVS